jgi:hypothetical protein
MPQIMHSKGVYPWCYVVVALLVIVWGGSCSTLQPPDPNGPRSTGPAYPVVLVDEGATQEEALIAWRQLAPRYGSSDQAEISLDTFTATIKALPTNLSTPILLPKVGTEATPTEEETRESLRRFIDDWRALIGAEPAHLSLVERTDEPSGTKLALYEQRPFRYALRGGYGKLLIRFNNNRQLIEISSSCIRNAERLQAALATITPRITAEEAVAHVRGKAVTVTDASGRTQSLTLSANEPAEVTQLVVYALPSSDRGTLELHLAWEIETPNSPAKRVYLDAISDQIIAAG